MSTAFVWLHADALRPKANYSLSLSLSSNVAHTHNIRQASDALEASGNKKEAYAHTLAHTRCTQLATISTRQTQASTRSKLSNDE